LNICHEEAADLETKNWANFFLILLRSVKFFMWRSVTHWPEQMVVWKDPSLVSTSSEVKLSNLNSFFVSVVFSRQVTLCCHGTDIFLCIILLQTFGLKYQLLWITVLVYNLCLFQDITINYALLIHQTTNSCLFFNEVKF